MYKNLLNHIKGLSRAAIARIAACAGLAVCTAAVLIIIMFSVNTVSVNDGSKVTQLKTLKSDTAQILSLAGYDDNTYVINETVKNKNRINIDITLTFPVYVTANDDVKEITFASGTVADVLTLCGIELDTYDIVSLPLDSAINETVYIDVVNVDYETEVYTDSASNTIVTCQKKLVNGSVVETEILSQQPLKKAAATVVAATAPVKPEVAAYSDSINCISTLNPASPIELDANGVPISYSRHITVTATAYTYTGHNCSTGVAPQPGYIAVNPAVIPYGTRMFIKSSDGRYIYGYAVAADTGGFIRKYPNNVDLFMETSALCKAFGRRSVEIYILD